MQDTGTCLVDMIHACAIKRTSGKNGEKLASLTYIQRAEARPKTMPAPPPPPRAAKPARERAPWATWHRTSAGRRPEENEAGGAKYAPRAHGCATARALEIRRVFENRFTTSNVMAQRRGLGLSGSLP